MHFTCSGLKVHVGHEKDMKTSAVNKIPCVNECNKTSTHNIIDNAYPQALQEAEYTSTHQSMSSPRPSGLQYFSLPHTSHYQRVSGVNNTVIRIIVRLSPLDDAVFLREYRPPARFLRIKGRRCSDPVSDVVGKVIVGDRSGHCLLSDDVMRRREGLVYVVHRLET